MPIVRIELLEGRSAAMKRDLIRSVTEAVVAALAVAPGQVRVLLHELPAELWSVGGATMAERRCPNSAREEGV
jgi:4-oxalocrotonate tautomerase family enzyme